MKIKITELHKKSLIDQPEPKTDAAPLPPIKREQTAVDESIERLIIEQVLSVDGGIKTAMDAGLEADHFTDPLFSKLFGKLAEQHANKQPICKLSALIDLQDNFELERYEEQRIIDLDDTLESSGLFLKSQVQTVIDRHTSAAIAAIVRRANNHLADGDEDRAFEMLEKARRIREDRQKASGSTIGADRKFNAAIIPNESPPILSLNGVTIARRGNISMLRGPDKSGKSHIMQAMIGACCGVGKLGFTTGLRSRVLYIDSEQSYFDFWMLVNGIRKSVEQGGGDADLIEAYWMTGESIQNIRKLISARLSVEQFGLALIDGYADLINDVNDPEESNSLVRDMMFLSSAHDCAIMGVLHLNPGSDAKSRGHLGSQLERKCETVLQVDLVEDEQRNLYTAKSRKAGISKSNGVMFKWDDEKGGFVTCEQTLGAIKHVRETTELSKLLDDIKTQKGCHVFHYGDLWRAIMDVKKCSERTAKSTIKNLSKHGLITKNEETGNIVLSVSHGAK